ncbi:ExbD/TolR family protein [Wenyingzhuangia sp. IMCC45533]
MAKGRNKVSAEFNMSSMTDIVFLLLIFFMLASTLVTVNAIDVLLPKAGGKTENKGVISVSITSDGTYYVDADKVDFVQLENILLTKLSGDKSGTLVIRGDQKSAYKNIMNVIDIANRNKIKMILAVKGQ